MQRILLLGGTLDARRIAGWLATRDDMAAVLSLAGVTSAPPDPGIPMRIGGFGGAEGLAGYITSAKITTLIDATHPFARIISANAAQAAATTQIRRLALWRPAWQPEPEDNWQEFASWAELIAAIPRGARVFAAAGQDGMKALACKTDIEILARALKKPAGLPPHIRFLKGLPANAVATEEAILKDEGITHLIAKNAGGEASRAKLMAARHLGLPVLLLARPAPPPGDLFADIESLIAAI